MLRSVRRRAEAPEHHKLIRYGSFILRDDTGYGVSFPDFLGCVAIGETVEAAVHHGREALTFHVEGLLNDGDSMPPPRSIDAINGDTERVAWRRGADIILIPLLRDRGSSML